MYYVWLYMLDRAYGGPEEGGWYFDCGAPILHQDNRVFASEVNAYELADTLNKTVARDLNEGRPEISSVNSEGQYRFLVGGKDQHPDFFPAEKPYYC